MTRSVPRKANGPLARAFLALAGEDPISRAFIDQAAQDAAPDDLPEVPVADQAQSLSEFLAFARSHKGKAPAVRLVALQGSRLDRLEIVQPDAPFLVDSVMGELAEQGLSVRAMVHPILDLPAGKGVRRVSMIQVVLDRVGADREAGLLNGVRATLADVHAAVTDFGAMRAQMAQAIAELADAPPAKNREEELAFLRWLADERFVYLGSRVYAYPRTSDGGYAPDEPVYGPEDGLGVLRDPERTVLRRSNEPVVLAARLQRRLADPPLRVAKSNLKSRVHRRAYMDYVGVQRFGPDGRPCGEIRFVGLFTADAYDEPAREVPLISAKVARALERARAPEGGHNDKRLKHILDTYPRDELFQASEDDLLAAALAILHLQDRPRVGLIERRDPFDRFASVLLYVPRERYDSALRQRAGELIAAAYQGRVSAFYSDYGEGALARVHFIIGFAPGEHAEPDLKALEAAIAGAARTWEDRFEAAIRESGRESDEVSTLRGRYARAFSAGYRERYDESEALTDLSVLETMPEGETAAARAFRNGDDCSTCLRFKLYRVGEPAPLADVLPILENMGLKAVVEHGFPLRRADAPPVWIHEFELDDPRGEHLVFTEVKQAFEQAFLAVWSGQTENDGFNRLVLELSVSWREAALVRALAKYRQQSGLDPSQPVQEAALSQNPAVARLILDLFRTRFDPAIRASLAQRQEQAADVMAEIEEALQRVASLDDDRVLRRLALLVAAIQRTNYYQLAADGRPKPYISFKVASRELADLPRPKPFREIFVWATHVEGVHLRFGPVARGGLRWSDRRDDFRTEVLGLAKAQQTKNAVIVPVGSKGGFYAKALPKGGTPDAVRTEGVRAYTTFLQGLLDITDNLDAEGKVIHPAGVVIHDGDDPYLVVAADKGTATFSDIANGIAESYGFWLGDAFASGGSKGYDHKVMGITARGAWEAVKRHFRELGKDIQVEPFTVVGVGDMSGDVFGNGMLLSRQTRLLAAFDHRHIFLDPNPDPAVSYAERERMFVLPRSSWEDYDPKKISRGGGVFARSLKSVPLSKEVQTMLGVTAASLTPAELMSAILKAPAELLYLGGVGTYVKASDETHAEVGDKANDALRVNASDLRVQVVGEGANLGFTQAGRIEFGLRGGRLNTDAIDNSAGVDSSDHEVNIKILTGQLERTGVLTRAKRDKLLRSMTEDVGLHVLAHNYDQTLALSLLQMDAPGELEPHARFMTRLEAAGRLDRAVEGLPDALTIAERAKIGVGLTRPESAVLLAYGKLELFDLLVEGAAPDDPAMRAVLEGYFPKGLNKFDEAMSKHRLRREIIATVLSNDIVNRCGPTFPSRLMEAAACDADAFARAYQASKAVLEIDRLWKATAALDGKAPAAGQMALFRRLAYVLRGETFWLARRAARTGETVDALIRRYGPGTATLKKLGAQILSPLERDRVEAMAARLFEAGAPEALAAEVANLQPLTVAADLVDLAEASSWPLEKVAHLYHQVGLVFAFDRVRAAAGAYAAGDAFERTALRRLLEDLLAEQAMLTRAVMDFSGSAQAADAPAESVKAFAAMRRDLVETAAKTIDAIETGGAPWTFAKLTIANAALRELAAEGIKSAKR